MGKKWDKLSVLTDGHSQTPNGYRRAANENDVGRDDVFGRTSRTSPEYQTYAKNMQAWHLTWLREAFRVLRPGGVAKVFSATRTGHRLAAAMEDAGFVLDSEHSLEAWSYGCLTKDTEILTQDGWAHYHKAKVGTLVLGFDLGTGQFDWQPVEETFEYPYDREAFHLNGDNSDHIVSVGHRCVVQRDGKWILVSAEELAVTEVVPCVHWSVQASRVPSPHLTGTTIRVDPLHYTGTVWCVKVSTGAFVARRNGRAFVTGNSGFPKSLNVGKALDKVAGVERSGVIGQGAAGAAFHYGTAGFGNQGVKGTSRSSSSWDVTAPATAEAKRFDGYGTALKPGWEPFLVGKKPYLLHQGAQ